VRAILIDPVRRTLDAVDLPDFVAGIRRRFAAPGWSALRPFRPATASTSLLQMTTYRTRSLWVGPGRIAALD
jgi:hypothetical protein